VAERHVVQSILEQIRSLGFATFRFIFWIGVCRLNRIHSPTNYRGRSQNERTTQEVLQETFVRVYTKRRTFELGRSSDGFRLVLERLCS